LIGNQFSATVSLDAREYHPEIGGSPIRGNQIHAGLRRYFGDRALTAFLSTQLIYNFGLEFQETGYESDGFLAWGVGAGLNMAVNESFSVEAAFMYEGMPDVGSHLKGDNATSSGFEHNLSGMVGYVALGYHF
jgi:opacity protein-like surface antigen